MANTGEVHIGDIGTVFKPTVVDDGSAVDVSGATSLSMVFEKPSGTTVTKTGTGASGDVLFNSDGTDGIIKYTATDIFDERGEWGFQVKVVNPAGTWNSDIEYFEVKDNL